MVDLVLVTSANVAAYKKVFVSLLISLVCLKWISMVLRYLFSGMLEIIYSCRLFCSSKLNYFPRISFGEPIFPNFLASYWHFLQTNIWLFHPGLYHLFKQDTIIGGVFGYKDIFVVLWYFQLIQDFRENCCDIYSRSTHQ